MRTLSEFKLSTTTEIDIVNEIAYDELDGFLVTVEGSGNVEVYQKMACETNYNKVKGIDIVNGTCKATLTAGCYVVPVAVPDTVKFTVGDSTTASIKAYAGTFAATLPVTTA